MTQVPFERSHPVVPLVYLVGTIGLVMFTPQPVYAALSLVGGLACSFALRGAAATFRGLRWQVPLLVLVCLANPLFTAAGSTELFQVGSMKIYAESLAYGAMMGCMMVASVLWFECAAYMLPEDKVLALGGKKLHTISLMVSMASQLVPRLVRSGNTVRLTASACTAAGNGDGSAADVRRAKKKIGRESLRGPAHFSTMLMQWALEDSLVRSDSMRARGWGAVGPRKRTTYEAYEFRGSDGLMLVGLACLLGLNFLLAYAACTQWHFYPAMPKLVVWWGYVPYAVQLILPTVSRLVYTLSWE